MLDRKTTSKAAYDSHREQGKPSSQRPVSSWQVLGYHGTYSWHMTYLQAGVPAVGHSSGEHPSSRVFHRVETFQRAARVRDENLTHLEGGVDGEGSTTRTHRFSIHTSIHSY